MRPLWPALALLAAGVLLLIICLPLCFWPAALGVALLAAGALVLIKR